MNSCVNTLRLFRILLHLIVIGLCISRARLRFSFFFGPWGLRRVSLIWLLSVLVSRAVLEFHLIRRLLFLLLKHFKHRFEIKRSLISRELFISWSKLPMKVFTIKAINGFHDPLHDLNVILMVILSNSTFGRYVPHHELDFCCWWILLY